jgi:ribosome maturation factor RimP
LEQKVRTIIEPVIKDLGFELLTIEVKDGSVQVMAENPETNNLGVDDCATISRAISASLDVEDPIKGAYRLEVSSPGIDRPLISEKDFEKFKDNEVKVELKTPNKNGQKRFRGMLNGCVDGEINLSTQDQGEVLLPYSSIKKAKLILTDELIKKAKQDIKTVN